MPSLYDAALSPKEKNALAKHTHTLDDEINLLRTLIARQIGPDGDGDMDIVIRLSSTIAHIAHTKARLAGKLHDATLQLAYEAALEQIDREIEDQQ